MKYVMRSSAEEREDPDRFSLKLLYSWPAYPLRFCLRRRLISKLVGWSLSTSLSNRVINAFVSDNAIDIKEYKVPRDGYPSFNAFFTRRLRKSRPFAADSLCSPADCKVLAFDSLDASFFVKHERFTIAQLLCDDGLAERYKDGSIIILRLSPDDYHRFHFPCDCVASPCRELQGTLDSVAPAALQRHVRILAQNKRCLTELSTTHFGRLLMVEVGALFVGSIQQTYKPGKVRQGDEKGFFQFGGSSIVLLAEHGKLSIDKDLLGNTAKGLETKVLAGERVGKAVIPSSTQPSRL